MNGTPAMYQTDSPEDAEKMGAFVEDAMSEADALASAGDPAHAAGDALRPEPSATE